MNAIESLFMLIIGLLFVVGALDLSELASPEEERQELARVLGGSV